LRPTATDDRPGLEIRGSPFEHSVIREPFDAETVMATKDGR
jgi:hypothetical protein